MIRDSRSVRDGLAPSSDSPSPPPANSGANGPSAGETPELIPARMLNEFTYCPRLGYLEWVQGEWAENLETRQGTFGHRRVDKADRKTINPPPSDDESDTTPLRETDPIHARSLDLSAPGEGLIAKCDLVELDGNSATPVDYKRGKPPDIPEKAWEPERVQLCAQGLILRENGYDCDRGVLYFVESKQRVTIEFDEQLITRTREQVQSFRATAAAGQIPPPLVDSPKCPRCSLVGICLPDETNHLKETDPEQKVDGEPRRLLPSRDDALPLYVQTQGMSVGKEGDRLTLKQKGQVLERVKLIDVSHLCVFGNVQITAQALRELSFRNIPVCHFSYGGWFHTLSSGLVHKNVELRVAQFATAADGERSLAIAKKFVVGMIRNCRTLLRRHLPELLQVPLRRLTSFRKDAERADSADRLLGLEGMAAKVYFEGFFKLLEGPQEFDVSARNRRPPTDPVNALLSFVYSLLVKELTITLHASGFDPMLGFYHRPRYGRPSLALDLAEEFRPLIADSVVLTVINNGEVSPASFVHRAGAVALTTAGRRAVIAAFERRLDTLVTHPVFGYRISYRRILAVQTRLLGRLLLGELSEYPNFCTR